MAYHNRDSEIFRPIDNGFPRSWGQPDPHLVGEDANGLYYRSRIAPQLSQEVDDCLAGTADFSDLSLDADQSWNEGAWKEPHASLAAFLRFSRKFREEVVELVDAFAEYNGTGDARHFIEEVGDVKWVVTALASNSGIVVSDAIKSRLFEYVAGTRQFDEGHHLSYPQWHTFAGSLAVKQGPLVVGDIDNLIHHGFVPQPSPIMNIEADERLSPTGIFRDLLFYRYVLLAAEERYKEDGFHVAPVYPNQSEPGRPTADMYLQLAAMANFVGSSFAEAIGGNSRKMTERIAINAIDKTDPNRQT